MLVTMDGREKGVYKLMAVTCDSELAKLPLACLYVIILAQLETSQIWLNFVCIKGSFSTGLIF